MTNSKGCETGKYFDTILCGDCTRILPDLPDELVDCVVTSPPYFGQRDYQSDLQIGIEKESQQFIDRLLAVFMQVQRVLKPTGTCWIVIGDKYENGSLLGTPWRLALALAERGWCLRSDIIWHKPNAMPSSVKSRPTTDHEYVFMLTKNAKDYFYDADAIREPHRTFTEESQMKGGRRHFGVRNGTPEQGKNGGHTNLHNGRWDQAFHPKGRNKRTVWSVPLSKFREAHFAVFPETLVSTCIAAGCPAGGLVLDPFFGAGTTGVVARKLGRHYLGIDCSQQYCELARKRIEGDRERRLF